MQENARIILNIIKEVKEDDEYNMNMKDQPKKDKLKYTWMGKGGQKLLKDLEKENMAEQGIDIYGLSDSDEDTDTQRSLSDVDNTKLNANKDSADNGSGPTGDNGSGDQVQEELVEDEYQQEIFGP